MRRFSHYLVLFGIFGVALLGWVVFFYDQAFRIALLVAVGTSYIAWGIIHHWLHDDLYPEVVLEYVAIAVLGSVVVISLLV